MISFIDKKILSKGFAVCLILVLTFFRNRVPTIDLVIFPYFMYIFAGIVIYKTVVIKRIDKAFHSKPLGLFLCCYFLISLYHLYARRANVFATWDVILNLSILFFLFYVNNNEDQQSLEKSLHRVSNFYIGFTTVLALAGLYAFVSNSLFTNLFGVENYSVGMVSSRLYVFTHPNGFGMMLTISLLLCLYHLLKGKSPLRYPIYGAVIVSNYIALVLTQSRNSLLCFFGGSALVLAIYLYDACKAKSLRRKWLPFCLYLGGFAVLVLLYLIFNQKAAQSGMEIRELGSHGVSTLNSRTYIWQSAFRLLGEKPGILLHGLLVDSVSKSLAFDSVNAHNTWIEVLLTSGVPGLLCILAFFVPIVWRLIKGFFTDSSLPLKALLACLFAVLASSLLESNLVFNSDVVNHIFFALLGYAVGLLRFSKETAQEQQ